ncbi:DUF4333 domain-containing protein [Lipingzhangella sp. LS1_29]|uniref:DUF4333 domain-containing protein n=1 Tax=Lipingzhangella rawalii TaxID=2055835 RepID=A0ABU2H363_9ACTN|nr:DUF4333 domain-containing protein [Lipingzhangella rawalii]MDS1269432.1 DUF4333 domain-containing protein [Lipingzhangella rawalii]
MDTRTIQVGLGTVAAGTLLALTSACEFDLSFGQQAVSGDEVAEQAATQLEQQVGQRPDEVTCPEDLPAEVDATIRCELTHAGETYGVTVTTTRVNDDDVEFDIEVDEQPSAY